MPKSIGPLTPHEFEVHGGQYWHRADFLKFQNGHREGCLTRYKTVSELPFGYDPFEGWRHAGTQATTRGAGDREASIARATRRARRTARIRCKASGFDSLFTFTYRANVQDRDLVARHWKEVVRRIRQHIPDFAYVAVLERQKRGALHIHVATHRLPPMLLASNGVKVKSWSVLRSIWRRVVGDLGGNFDESKRRFGAGAARAAGIANYITKYIAKGFDDGQIDKKRFWAGGSWPAPERVTLLFPAGPGQGRWVKGDGMREVWAPTLSPDVLELVFHEVAGAAESCTQWLHPQGHTYWVAAFVPQ